MRTCAAFVMTLCLAAPLRAQSPAEQPHEPDAAAFAQSAPPRHPAPYGAPASRRPPLGFRVFGLITEQAFTASTTFDGIFGSSMGTFFGGGGTIILPNGIFGEAAISHFSKTGERAFFSDGEAFPLGIPLKASITPIEFTGGYRFTLGRQPKVVPYAGAGVGSYGYTESSELTDTSADVSERHIGYLIVGGVEVRVSKWVLADAGVQYTHVPGILGVDGFSKDAGDDDLGGTAFRFKISVGR